MTSAVVSGTARAAGGATCPHCGGAVPAASFCQSCGKALPAVTRSEPRLIHGDVLPVGLIARGLVSHDLHKSINRAAYTLLGVGIVLVVVGGLAWGALSRLPSTPEREVMVMGGVVVLIVGALFLCLFSWAWKSPLAPSIIGVVLYGTLVALKVRGSIVSGTIGKPGNGIGGSGIGWLDVVVIALLVQGIQAAVRFNRMRGQRA